MTLSTLKVPADFDSFKIELQTYLRVEKDLWFVLLNIFIPDFN